MTFKLTTSHFEIEVDQISERAEDGGSFSNRRIRLVVGPEYFFFCVVDQYSKPTGEIAGDRVRFQASPHAYVSPRSKDDRETTAATMIRWFADGDLRGQGATDAVYHAFYVLEIRSALRGTREAWLKDWSPGWWSMFERMFGAMERAA